MANSIGPSDDFVGAGQSAVWNRQGTLMAQLDAMNEGLLIYDAVSGKVVTLIDGTISDSIK